MPVFCADLLIACLPWGLCVLPFIAPDVMSKLDLFLPSILAAFLPAHRRRHE
jgi:hypothetical protein